MVQGTYSRKFAIPFSLDSFFFQSGRASIDLIQSDEMKDNRKKFRSRLTVRNATKEDSEHPFVCSAKLMTGNFVVNDTVSVYGECS